MFVQDFLLLVLRKRTQLQDNQNIKVSQRWIKFIHCIAGLDHSLDINIKLDRGRDTWPTGHCANLVFTGKFHARTPFDISVMLLTYFIPHLMRTRPSPPRLFPTYIQAALALLMAAWSWWSSHPDGGKYLSGFWSPSQSDRPPGRQGANRVRWVWPGPWELPPAGFPRPGASAPPKQSWSTCLLLKEPVRLVAAAEPSSCAPADPNPPAFGSTPRSPSLAGAPPVVQSGRLWTRALGSRSPCKSLSLLQEQAPVEGRASGGHSPRALELEMAARCRVACHARSNGSVCTLEILGCAGLWPGLSLALDRRQHNWASNKWSCSSAPACSFSPPTSSLHWTTCCPYGRPAGSRERMGP